MKLILTHRKKRLLSHHTKRLRCPMCKELCYSGYVYMLHNTLGCVEAKRY